MELRADYFWDLTPKEWSIKLEYMRMKHEERMQLTGLTTWYTGIASQSDLSKVGFRRWMDRFKDPEKVEQERQTELEKGNTLWEQLQRNRNK
jgi:hypothetical protein